MSPAGPDLLGGASRSDVEGQAVALPIIAGPLSVEDASVDLGSVRPQAFLPHEGPCSSAPGLVATLVALASHGVFMAILASSPPSSGLAGEVVEIPVEIVAAIPEPSTTFSSVSIPNPRPAAPQAVAEAPAAPDPTPEAAIAEREPETKEAATPPAAVDPSPAPDLPRTSEPSAPQASTSPGESLAAPAAPPTASLQAAPEPVSAEPLPAPAHEAAEPAVPSASTILPSPLAAPTPTPAAGAVGEGVSHPPARPPATAQTPPRPARPPQPPRIEPALASRDRPVVAGPRQRASAPGSSERRTASTAPPRATRQPGGHDPDGREASPSSAPTASPEAIAAYNRAVIERIAAAKHYPEQARVRGAQGTVVVSFSLGASGRVTSASVRRSSTDADLDAEAMSTVRHAGPFGPPPHGASLIFAVPLRFSLD